MNRSSQLISDKCTSLLADLIKSSGPIVLDKLTFGSSLKYLVLNDPNISIEITSPTSFDVYESRHGLVVPNGPALSQARLADFFLGSSRVRKQYEAVLNLRNSGAPTAWLLVSAYYCAFFACIEICKLLNRTSFSMERDDFEVLKHKAVGPHHAKFFSMDNSNFVGVEYAGKLQFRSSGAKPHAAAWDNAHLALRPLYAKKTWPEADRLLELLCNPDYSPSRIRNSWNYKRSDYFGNHGEKIGLQFKKLVGNPESAAAWLLAGRGRLNSLEPCIIAVLCEALSVAVIDAASRGGDLLRETNTLY